MKKTKLVVIGIVILVAVIIGVVWYFNISLTSLPTTFSNLIEEELPEIDYDKIKNLELRKADNSITENIIIEDKDKIQSVLHNLLNNDQRIYNGGRIDMDRSDFNMNIAERLSHLCGVLSHCLRTKEPASADKRATTSKCYSTATCRRNSLAHHH